MNALDRRSTFRIRIATRNINYVVMLLSWLHFQVMLDVFLMSMVVCFLCLELFNFCAGYFSCVAFFMRS